MKPVDIRFTTENIHENKSIDVSFLPSGVYMFEVVQEGKTRMVRVFKQ